MSAQREGESTTPGGIQFCNNRAGGTELASPRGVRAPMRSVDAELWWGDERVSLTSHPVTLRVGRGCEVELPCEPFVPVQLKDGDLLVTIPAGATPLVHTANGWRDLRGVP